MMFSYPRCPHDLLPPPLARAWVVLLLELFMFSVRWGMGGDLSVRHWEGLLTPFLRASPQTRGRRLLGLCNFFGLRGLTDEAAENRFA